MSNFTFIDVMVAPAGMLARVSALDMPAGVASGTARLIVPDKTESGPADGRPEPVADNRTALPPGQILDTDGLTVNGAGALVTFTTDACLFIQPLASMPVTVYVVVDGGFATIEVPVVALRPAAGDHVYVTAPEAVKPMPDPEEQMAPPSGVTAIVGNGLMRTFVVVESKIPE